jgi:hypothetical protein
MIDANRLASGIVRVGDGRGFVIRCQNYHGHEELVVITAAHCLPHFPPPHPAMYLEERTYQRILGPLGRAGGQCGRNACSRTRWRTSPS